jgi:hypothetical protein
MVWLLFFFCLLHIIREILSIMQPFTYEKHMRDAAAYMVRASSSPASESRAAGAERVTPRGQRANRPLPAVRKGTV